MQLLFRYWYIVATILILVVIKLAFDEYNSAQQQTATTKAVVTQQGKVIDNAVQAREARDQVLDPSRLTNYCQCLRTSRTAGSCERYLPNNAANYDKPASLCAQR